MINPLALYHGTNTHHRWRWLCREPFAKALAAAGHEGVVFDNLLFGHRGFVRWGPLIEGDIRNAAALDKVFSAYRFDAVMHFAYVGESVSPPADIMTST